MTSLFRSPFPSFLVALLTSLAIGSDAAAAKTYRWTDEAGQVQLSDSMPSGAAARGYQIIDPKTGTVLETVAPAKTAEQKAREAAEKAAREKALEAAEERRRKDNVLLALYSTVEDIETARDRRLERIDQRIRDYTEIIERNRRRIREGLGNEADMTQIRKLSAARARLEFDRQDIRDKFETEIKRFQKLKKVAREN
jgi:hypothetical protein